MYVIFFRLIFGSPKQCQRKILSPAHSLPGCEQLIGSPTPLEKGRLVAHLRKVGVEYNISFDFMPTSFSEPIRNILHMHPRHSPLPHRQRCHIPMINACPPPHLGCIEVTNTVNQRANRYNNNTIRFATGQWNTIELSQVL